MGIFSVNDLRTHYGAKGKDKSDEELLHDYAPRVGMAPEALANKLGYDGGSSGSLTRERISGGIDNFKSQVLSAGEAVSRGAGMTGAADYLDRKREDNKFRADVAAGRAKELGGIDSYKDVTGLASGANYVGGLIAQTAPQLALQAAVGLATGGVGLGLSTAGRLAAGAAAMYPANLGDVLDNQREQADGKTDLLSAAALALPYTAVDSMTGLGKLATVGKKSIFKGVEEAAAKELKPGMFDGIGGVKGAAARGAWNGGKASLEEGAGELFQEGMNQYGRMAVDPTQKFYDDSVDAQGNPTKRNSAERFKESFVGGAVLGGLAGGATGTGRVKAPVNDTPGESTDILTPAAPAAPPLAITNQGPTGYLAFPDGSITTGTDQELMARHGLTQADLATMRAQGAYSPVAPTAAPAPAAPDPAIQAGIHAAAEAAAAAKAAAAKTKADIDAAKKEFSARKEAATTALVDIDPATGKPAIQLKPQDVVLHHTMLELKDAGLISEGQYIGFAGAIKEGLQSNDTKAINAVRKAVEEIKNPKPVAAAAPSAAKPVPAAVAAPVVAADPKPAPVVAAPVAAASVAAPAPVAAAAVTPAPVPIAVAAPAPVAAAPVAAAPVAAPALVTKKPAKLGKPAKAGQEPGPVTAAKPVTVTPAPAAVTPEATPVAAPAVTPAPVPVTPAGGVEIPSDLTKYAGRAVSVTTPSVTPGAAPIRATFKDAKAKLESPTASPALKQAIMAQLVKEDAAKAKPRLVAAPAEQKFESLPELADAIGKEQGWPPAVAKAYTENKVLGRSLSKVASELGVGKSTAHEMVQKMHPLVEAAKSERLEAGVAPAESDSVAAPTAEKAQAEEAAPDQRAETEDVEGADDSDPAAPEISATGDLVDEDNVGQGQDEDGRSDSHINISDNPYGEGKTRTETDDAAAKFLKANGVKVTGAVDSGRVNDTPLPIALKRANLTKAEQAALVDRYNAADVTGFMAALAKDVAAHNEAGALNGASPAAAGAVKRIATAARFSKAAVDEGSTPADIRTSLAGLMPINEDKVVIAASMADIPTNVARSVGVTANTQAFVVDGKAYLIADQIAPGTERAVFLHEVGAHLGMENLLGEDHYDALTDKIVEWAGRTDGSVESKLARKAMERVFSAATPDEQANSEMVAYFVEEAVNAGINPTALTHLGELGAWFKALISAFKSALKKLGLVDAKSLTAQDIVDIAYGAAKIEMDSAVSATGDAQFSKSVPAAANIPPPILDGGKGIAQWLKNLTRDKLWRTMPSTLGFLSTEQMADRFKDIPMVRAFSDTMQAMAGRAEQIKVASDRINSDWSALRKTHGETVDNRFGKMLLDASTLKAWPTEQLGVGINKHLDAKDADLLTAHNKLKVEFNALPAAYRSLFQAVIADKTSQRDQQVAGLRKGIVEAYYPEPGATGLQATTIDAAAGLKKDERAAFLTTHGTSAVNAKLLSSLWADIDQHATDFKAMPGPYFPKMRFGDHIVSYKSGGFKAAEAALASATADLQAKLESETYLPVTQVEQEIAALGSRLKRATVQDTRTRLKQEIEDAKVERNTLMLPIVAARAVVTERQKALTALKNDGQHYGVEFYETRAQAQVNEQRLLAHFGSTGYTVRRDLKNQFLRSMDGVTPDFMRRIEDKMASALPGADAQKVKDSMRELYLRLQPENSALKSQLKRLDVSGVRPEEARRAYSMSSLRAAHSISRLEYGGKLHENVNKLRFERDDEDAKLIGNELAARIGQNMAVSNNPILSGITNLTYMSYLGMSPSFMVTQITQPWIISAPVMAARHGLRTTAKLLSKGGLDAAKLLKGSYDKDRRMKFLLDPTVGVQNGTLTFDEAKMLTEMLDTGRIDITITHDLGAASAGTDGGMLSTAAGIASYPAQQLEVINRVATALAAYRAEKAKTGSHIDAVKYADTLVADTHLNYAAENRARHMHPSAWGGYGRVMFQFRAYQQGMLYLVYKNMVDGFGAKKDPEARKAVVYLAGMQLATAGLAGMPVPGVLAVVVGMLYKAFQDDDDEKDLKEMLFQGIKSVVGETGALAATKGIPAALGVDVSGRVGLGSIASIAPYADDRKDGREWVTGYFAAMVGGPALGMAMNWAEAVKAAGKGDFFKAAAMAAPKVLADPIRAVGYQANGLTDSRGNTILAANEMSVADSLIKSAGFTPSDIGRVQDQRSAFYTAKKNRDDVRAKLLADFAHARMKGGDTAAIREEVLGFNSRHPDARILPANMEQAVVKRRQAERNLHNGVPVGKHDRQLAQDVGVY